MDIIQEVFVGITVGFIVLGFVAGIIANLVSKPKRNRLNK
jgi:hypothetical protein